MDSPRSGARRATAASWALFGLGIAGVAGTSTLAYADTLKPPATEVPVVAVEPAVPELAPTPVLDVPPVPDVVTTTADTPLTPPPIDAGPPAPAITPQQQEIAPRHTVEQAPAPTTRQAPAPTASAPTTKRRNLTPTTVMAPKFSPHITVSRGS